MTIHVCKRCGYTTKWTSNLTKHLKQEIPCSPRNVDHQMSREELLAELQRTKRKYVRREGDNQELVETLLTVMTRQQETMTKQQETVNNLLKDRAATIINNKIHIHVTPEGVQTLTGLQVNPFGSENDSYIKGLPLLDIVRDNIEDIEKACLECIWRIWFSKEHPENHNTLFRNWHDRVAYVLNDSPSGRFYYRDAEEVMREMIKWVRGMINADMQTHGNNVFSEQEYEQIIIGLNEVFMKMKSNFPRKEMDDLLRLATDKTRDIFPYSRKQMQILLT